MNDNITHTVNLLTDSDHQGTFATRQAAEDWIRKMVGDLPLVYGRFNGQPIVIKDGVMSLDKSNDRPDRTPEEALMGSEGL